MAEEACCCGGPIFLLFGLALLAGGVQRYLLYQKVSNTPTSKVRSAAVGLVELSGKARMEKDMESPISKGKCVFWKVTGEYYYQSKNSSGWREFFRRVSGVPFYLEDGTGRMFIDPKGAEVDIPSDFRWEGHMKEFKLLGFTLNKRMDEQVLAYVDGDPSVKSAFRGYSGRRLRVTEYFIGEGDPLYVLGNAEPREGASSAVAHENLVMKKGAVEQIMYISDSGETNVKGKMFWGMAGMLAGGVVLSGIGLLLTLMTMGLSL
ncbi:MAG: hypothetical protein AB1295_03640 [Candidatus Micrarchaeota archaeon]